MRIRSFAPAARIALSAEPAAKAKLVREKSLLLKFCILTPYPCRAANICEHHIEHDNDDSANALPAALAHDLVCVFGDNDQLPRSPDSLRRCPRSSRTVPYEQFG